MDDLARTKVDYAQIELLLQQHKYDEALPLLSSLVEKDPSDRQARLCRLLVMRILILRHLLSTQAIGLSSRATAIAPRLSVSTPAFFAFRYPSGFQLIARLRDSVYSLPVRLDKYRLAITIRSPIHKPWSRDSRFWNLFQFIPRLCDSIGAFLARHDKRRIAAIVVPLALVVPVSVYVLVARHGDNRPHLAARSAAPDSASRAAVSIARPQPGNGNSTKPLIVANADSLLDQSSFHRVLRESDDLNRPLLDLEKDALSSSAAQNIAPRRPAVERQADVNEETRLAKVNGNHAAPKHITKRSETSALKTSRNEHKNRVADAPKKLMARYQTKQVIPIRKSAHFAAPTIKKIAKGTPVDVLAVNNSWAEVTLRNDVNDNVTGFVRVEFLVPDAVGSL